MGNWSWLGGVGLAVAGVLTCLFAVFVLFASSMSANPFEEMKGQRQGCWIGVVGICISALAVSMLAGWWW